MRSKRSLSGNLAKVTSATLGHLYPLCLSPRTLRAKLWGWPPTHPKHRAGTTGRSSPAQTLCVAEGEGCARAPRGCRVAPIGPRVEGPCSVARLGGLGVTRSQSQTCFPTRQTHRDPRESCHSAVTHM